MNLPQHIRTKNFETQITGLDDLLRGGLILPTQNNEDQQANGLVILLKGKPGTGKTTLALQLMYHLTQVLKNKINEQPKDEVSQINFSKAFNHSQYFSIEQSQNELEEKLMNLVICRIFDDMQCFIVSDKSKLDDYPNKELIEIYEHIYLLTCFFETLNKTFNKRKKGEEIKKYIIKHFDDLKYFFENFQYDRFTKKIVPTKCFQIDDTLYNYHEIQLPEIKPNVESFKLKKITFCSRRIKSEEDFKIIVGILKKFDKQYERIQIPPTFRADSLDKSIISEFKKRLNTQLENTTNFQLDKNTINDIAIGVVKIDGINLKTIQKLIQKKGFLEPEHLGKLVHQEFKSITKNHYHSQLPQDFSVEVKTGESVHINADSPFNFMSAQKVHEFINEIDIGTSKNPKFYPCIVIDGLNILSEKEKKLVSLGKLVKALKNNSFFSIIVYDGEIDGSLYQDYYADLVIDLKGDVEKNMADYFLHQMQITKSRFQQAALGWHQYKIKELGIQIFRSVHFHVHINNYQSDQLLESFSPAIDSEKFKEYFTRDKQKISQRLNIEQILINPAPGSFTAIFGARATFKTALTLKFLYNVNQKKDTPQGDSLLVSLVDNYETLKESSFCPMAKYHIVKSEINKDSEQFIECDKCHKHLYIMHQRSGCINSHEFFHNLDKRVSDHKKKTSREITRLAFWDLAQLEYRFPLLAADPMFLPGLVEYTKKKKIALIVMGAGNSRLTPAASAIADNVIFCWRSQVTQNAEALDNWKKENDGLFKDNQNYFQITESELKPGRNMLCLYVDRCQGQLGNEGKELSFIPIESDSGIGIKCSKITKGGRGKYTPTGFNRLDNYSLIDDAKRTIDTIIDMQGMGSVNR